MIVVAACVALAACSSAPETARKEVETPKKEKAPEVFQVNLDTSKGPVTIEVHREWAPIGVDHFYNLVKTGFFDNARFFRVVRGFVVQFGIAANPETHRLWQNTSLPDDPVSQHNTRGMVTYATRGAEFADDADLHQSPRQSAVARRAGIRAVREGHCRDGRGGQLLQQLRRYAAGRTGAGSVADSVAGERISGKPFPAAGLYQEGHDTIGNAPTRRGPGSYQYRVKLERRGPAGSLNPPGCSFLACCLGGRLLRVDLLQAPDADRIAPSATRRLRQPPCAPLIVVMQGTRYATAARRIAFSSLKRVRAGRRVDDQLQLTAPSADRPRWDGLHSP